MRLNNLQIKNAKPREKPTIFLMVTTYIFPSIQTVGNIGGCIIALVISNLKI